MRPDPACKHRVAVDVEVLRGNRRRHIRARLCHERRRLSRGDVFEHHSQAGQVADERRQNPFDKHRLAVKDIDMGVGHFAVDQQRHADRFHPFQHAADIGDIGHAMGGTGGGMGGIELGGSENPFGMTTRDFIRCDRVGQVCGHQRGEARPGGRNDPRPIGPGRFHSRYRRGQVGHHDRPGKLLGSVLRHPFQHRPIAQMDVPIIGAADRQASRRIGHPFPLGGRHPICHP